MAESPLAAARVARDKAEFEFRNFEEQFALLDGPSAELHSLRAHLYRRLQLAHGAVLEAERTIFNELVASVDIPRESM